MSLNETIGDLNTILPSLMKDLTKVLRGNKTAAQRVRVGTLQLEKVGKRFRKESILVEKKGKRGKKRHLRRRRNLTLS